MNPTSYDTETADPKIVIRQTVDGVPTETADATVRTHVRSTSRRPQRKEKPKGKSDPYIWGIYLLLLFISVIELFSASSSEVTTTNVYAPLIRHGIFLGLGLAIILVLQRLHYGYLSRFAVLFALFSMGLLVVSNLFGANINGAQRAIIIGGFTIQPAEIAKIAVVVALATILGRNQQPLGVSNRGVILSVITVSIFAALTWQNGMTNALLLMGVSISMFLIGGIQWRKLGYVLAGYLVVGGLIMGIKKAQDKISEFDRVATTEVVEDGAPKGVDRSKTRDNRISRWLAGVHPEDPIDDYNRQVVFAKLAQANGGILGQGPGNSRESARLPLAFSDYIYSIIVEDTGLVGGLALLALYLCLVARAGRVAYKCSRAFPAFLILGCAVLIVLQALVHMAIVTGLAPVSGQPLPFISKGGTSILVMSAAIGIMLSVSRHAVTSGNKKEISAELKNLPDDLKAANISGN